MKAQAAFPFRGGVKFDFDGQTYEPAKDKVRLNRQLQLVFDYMKDGHWHTLSEISQATGAPEASVSARIRDMKKARFGAYDMRRQRRDGAGLFEYRLVMP